MLIMNIMLTAQWPILQLAPFMLAAEAQGLGMALLISLTTINSLLKSLESGNLLHSNTLVVALMTHAKYPVAGLLQVTDVPALAHPI